MVANGLLETLAPFVDRKRMIRRAAVPLVLLWLGGCQIDQEVAPVMPRADVLTLLGEVRSLEFSAAHNIAWLGSEAVAVPDPSGGRVAVFDTAGNELPAIGRQGDGPGEFRWPLLVAATGEDGLLVGDSQPPSVTLVGATADSEPVRLGGLPGMPVHLLSGNAEEVWVVWTGFEFNAKPRVGVLEAGASRARTMFVIEDARNGVVPAVMDHNGLVYVGTNPGEYEIRQLTREGRHVQDYGVKLPPRFPNDSDVERQRQFLSDGFARMEMPIDEGTMQTAIDTFREKAKPYFGTWGFAIDADDRLWVATLRSGQLDSTRVDVFSAVGEPVQMRVRDKVLALAIRDEFLAVLVERAGMAVAGMHGIDIYNIERQDDR